MFKMHLRNFRSDERGATAIEYGLITGIISAVVITIFATGTGLGALYQVIDAVVTALT